MKTNIHFLYLPQFFLEWKMFHTKVVEEIKTHVLCSIYIYIYIYILNGKSYPLWDNVEKYCTSGQNTEDNILWRMCISCWIHKATNTHSRICNTYSSPTATMVARTRLCVTLYVLRLSCWNCKAILMPRLYTLSHVDREIEEMREATLPAVSPSVTN